MESLFTVLTHAVEGQPAIAMAAALAWGIISVVLSPCHIATIPLVVGFISREGRVSTRRAFLISLMIAGGLLVTIAAVGIITGVAGRGFGDIGSVGSYVVAGVFFVVGLHLMDVIPMPWASRCGTGIRPGKMLPAFVLGLLFGLAVGPCTFAFMAPILGITFLNLSYGILLLAMYAIGHCTVIVLAGTFTEALQRFLKWNAQSKGPVVMKRICGAIVLLGGVYLIYKA